MESNAITWNYRGILMKNWHGRVASSDSGAASKSNFAASNRHKGWSGGQTRIRERNGVKVTNELRRNAQRAARVYIPREFLSKPIWLSAMRCHTIDAVASKWHFAFVMRVFREKICLLRRVLFLHSSPALLLFVFSSLLFHFFTFSPSPLSSLPFYSGATSGRIPFRVGANLIRNAN